MMTVTEKHTATRGVDVAPHPLRRASDALPAYSVIVPCYNEVRGIRSTLKELASVVSPAGAEIIVVDESISLVEEEKLR